MAARTVQLVRGPIVFGGVIIMVWSTTTASPDIPIAQYGVKGVPDCCNPVLSSSGCFHLSLVFFFEHTWDE